MSARQWGLAATSDAGGAKLNDAAVQAVTVYRSFDVNARLLD